MPPLTFPAPGQPEPLSLPALWEPDIPAWLRQLGRTTVLVIDDQIQCPADLSDEGQLRARIGEPLNVEFVFCPECAAGQPTARDGRWFAAVEERLRRHGDRLAAAFLDVMFDGESDPLNGSGIRFLSRIHAIIPGLPVLILTQARNEQSLHEAVARRGLHLGFFPKDSPDQAGGLSRFLCEHGWLADPSFCAYSTPMRAALSGLRQYALRRPRLGTGMPQPILITADSGEGKTRTAQLAAGWLRQVTPWWLRQIRTGMPPGVPAETLNCNGLVGRSQDAKIAVFGRGVQDPARERPDASGLVVLGRAQQASGGILIFDELGNSDMTFQEMLLAFVETGRTQPEFFDNRMNEQSLGPLDVLCLFTAQPRHIQEGRIKPDLERRYARGTTLVLPPLVDRPADVVPLFYEVLAACRRAQEPRWKEPADVHEVLLPEAQDWLRQQVATQRLSASLLTDLVGQSPLRVLGVPYLQYRLGQLLRPRQKALPLEEPAAEPALTPDGFELVRQLTEGLPRFATSDARLRGQFDKVKEAAARLILAYLDACLDRASGGRKDINVIDTCRLVQDLDDDQPLKLNAARDTLKEPLLTSERGTREEILRSERLARLAIDIVRGNRSVALRSLLAALCEDPQTARWLHNLGWEDAPVPAPPS